MKRRLRKQFVPEDQLVFTDNHEGINLDARIKKESARGQKRSDAYIVSGLLLRTPL